MIVGEETLAIRRKADSARRADAAGDRLRPAIRENSRSTLMIWDVGAPFCAKAVALSAAKRMASEKRFMAKKG